MKQLFLLIFTLICSVLYCNAQSNIEDSPFVNIPISSTLKPISQSISKKKTKSSTDNVDGFGWSIVEFDLKVDYLRLPDGKTATFFPHK